MGLRRFFDKLFGFIGDVVGWLTGAKDKDFDGKQQGYLLNKQSNIEPIPVVYGNRKIGGTRVFVATSGTDNQYLYVVLVLCEGEIQAIDDVYIDDVISTDSRFSGLVTINKYTGTDAQTADSMLVNASIGWTSSHKLSGLAYLAIRFKFDADAFGAGIPTVHAVVRGKKVYDPRTSTTAYSDNPALCLRDYLTNTRYGKGLSASLINDTQFNTAATTCETTVTKYTGAPSDTQLFQCNAIIDTSQTLFDNVKILLTGMRGLLPFQNGQYGLIIDGDPSSSFDFNHDNIVGGITISSANKNNKYNQVVAKFTNPDTNWMPDSITYPEVDSGDDTTWLSEDNGERLRTEITLPTTTDVYVARDIARVVLKSSRSQSLQISFISTSEGLNCSIGDVVTVTHETPGWTNKEFKILSLELLDNGEVNVVAQEHDGAIYTWDDDGQVDAVVSSTLPNPFTVAAPTSLAVTETSAISKDGTVAPALLFTWTASADSFVTSYEVQFLGTSSFDYGLITQAYDENENWGNITTAYDETENYGSITETVAQDAPYYQSAFVNTTQYILTGIATNVEFAFRVRGVNELGVKSAWVSTTSTAVGDTTPPALPSGITATGGLQSITVQWTNPTDADFAHVEIFTNTVDNFASATLLGKSGSTEFTHVGLGYNVTRYYWLKSVDYSFNKSAQTSSVSGTSSQVDTDAFTAEVNALFQEAGAYGIEPVSSLPAEGAFDGQIVFLTTDSTLYVWDATAEEWTDEIFTTSAVAGGSVTAASFAAGIEPISIVASLPSPTGYTGPNVLLLTTDKKLYRYDSSVPEFTTLIDAVDLDGTLASANFPNSLRPVENVSSLPSTGNFEGRVVYLTTDDKLYRHTGSAWTSAVPATDLTGTLASGQIADSAITSAKIAEDAVTNAKIAVDAIQGDVIAASAITETKIASNSISTAKIQASAITANEIAANAVTATQIQASAVTADKISSGAVTSAKIDSLAITTDKLAANAVTAAKITAGTITSTQIATNTITSNNILTGTIQASNIAAGAISSTLLAADSVVAGKIAANAVTSNTIAADAITAGKIAAGAISTDALQSNVITTDKLAANSVTAGILAASGVITSAAQITDGIITNAKIENGTITSAKIGTAEIETLNIAGQAVTVPASAYSVSGQVIYADTPDLPPAGVTETIQTLSMSVISGSPVFLNGSCFIDLSSGTAHNAVQLELYRGATKLIEYNKSSADNTEDFWVIQYVDTPSATTTYTYYLKIQFYPSSSFQADVLTASYRLLTALQTKR